MSSDPREQALLQAYQLVSEHFPHVVMVAEAQFLNAAGQPQFTQMLRWYGDSTMATGLMVYASDLLSRRFAPNAVPSPAPSPAPGEAPPPPHPTPSSSPIPGPQEERLQRALQILGAHFACVVIVAQGEPELVGGRGERSLKIIRFLGPVTMVAGLAEFASNALRRMALE